MVRPKMPPPSGKSEHVIGNCISLFAITIVMLADYAAMNITSKHVIVNCILRLAISINTLAFLTMPAGVLPYAFYAHGLPTLANS